MKRMVSLISEQVFPNFIPLNEPATRPDVLYGIFTPTDLNMMRRWNNLRIAVAARFPNMRTEDVPIKDAYDAQAIRQQCAIVVHDHPDDDLGAQYDRRDQAQVRAGVPATPTRATRLGYRHAWRVYDAPRCHWHYQ